MRPVGPEDVDVLTAPVSIDDRELLPRRREAHATEAVKRHDATSTPHDVNQKSGIARRVADDEVAAVGRPHLTSRVRYGPGVTRDASRAPAFRTHDVQVVVGLACSPLEERDAAAVG